MSRDVGSSVSSACSGTLANDTQPSYGRSPFVPTVSNVASLNPHYSSGVGNHFFYLLAEGSGTKTIGGLTHTSPTCNNSAVAGIGRDAAQRMSSTTYPQAGVAMLNAARDLFGAGSTQYNAVAAAWSAVSVN
jgi:Zn-dependent metalloprotease